MRRPASKRRVRSGARRGTSLQNARDAAKGRVSFLPPWAKLRSLYPPTGGAAEKALLTGPLPAAQARSTAETQHSRGRIGGDTGVEGLGRLSRTAGAVGAVIGAVIGAVALVVVPLIVRRRYRRLDGIVRCRHRRLGAVIVIALNILPQRRHADVVLHHVGGAGLVGHAVDDPLVERLLVGSPEAHAVPVGAQGVVLTALGTIHGQSAAHLGIVADGVVHRHGTLGLGLDSTGITLRRDAHGDGLADVLAGQLVGSLIGALDGLAVPQPLVAQVSVGHAAGLGSQGLAALQLAVDGHRAGDIRQSALAAAGIAGGIIRIGVGIFTP